MKSEPSSGFSFDPVVLAELPVAYHSLSSSGLLVEVNDLWLKTFGHNREDVIGKPFTDFLSDDSRDRFELCFEVFKDVGEIHDEELAIRSSCGSWKVCSMDGRVIRDPDGNFARSFCILRDVSRQYMLEEEMQRLSRRNAALLGAIPDIVMEVDRDKIYTWANNAGIEFFGSDVVGKSVDSFFSGKQEVYEKVEPLFSGRKSVIYVESWQRRKDGETRLLAWFCRPLKDDSGEICGALSTARDITDERELRNSLQRSEAHYRALFESAHDTIFLMDRYKIIDCNSRTLEMFDCERGQIIGQHPYADSLSPVKQSDGELSRTKACSLIDAVLSGKPQNFEWCHRRLNGELFDAEISLAPLNIEGSGLLIAIVRDISLRKVALRALRESEGRLQSLLSALPAGFFIQSKDGRISMINDFAATVFGKSREELIGETSGSEDWQLVDEDGRLILPDEHPSMHTLRTGNPIAGAVCGIFADNPQRCRWLLINTEPLFGDDGEVHEVVVSFLDISELRRAEAKRLKSDELLASIFKAAPIGLGIVKDRNLIFVNDGICKLTGYSKDELIGRNSRILYADDAEYERVGREKYAMIAKYGVGEVETVYQHKNGDFINILLRSCALDENDFDKGYVFTLSDITDHQRLEDERIRSAKFESLSVLAGGLAHDFNNILTAILGNISFALMQLEADSSLREILEHAEKASLRARELTRHLLTFAKGGHPVVESVDTSKLLQDSIEFSLHGMRIKAEIKIPEDLATVAVDVSQFNQVVSNLIINANEVLTGEDGKIWITAGNVTIESANPVKLESGDYVWISVTDNGPGIAGENLERVFDPYYSTKPGGTGLGLATAYSILNRHGGTLTVESPRGAGARFTIFLPVSDKSADFGDTADVDPEENSSFRFGLRVLLMDDDAQVRAVLDKLLCGLGCNTVDVPDGAAAVLAYEEAMNDGQRFDVVILDLTVPGGMGGRECVKKILAIDPGAVCVVSSGYSDDNTMARFNDYGFKGMISKPYTHEELVSVLNKIMQSQSH